MKITWLSEDYFRYHEVVSVKACYRNEVPWSWASHSVVRATSSHYCKHVAYNASWDLADLNAAAMTLEPVLKMSLTELEGACRRAEVPK